jgi:hypothetical protein
MNWTRAEDYQWHQLLGTSKLQNLVGKVQERYRIVREAAERKLDAWIAQPTPVPLPVSLRHGPMSLGAALAERLNAKTNGNG